ncbi:VanZ family protein [Chelativorans xinjiangense]|uniref:VanZ family protein n=1 Tax=Chelativorans xinjiangense TaxID=2681485 RepID=UPI0019150FCA|nr:VanZ family protein [Chelativorans xinjiangense]
MSRHGKARRHRLMGLLVWARRAAPWLIFAAILLATLSPLDMRPRTGSVHAERFAAFALLGSLYAVAFPRRLVLVCIIVAFSTVALELLQLSLTDRHPRFSDLAVKLAGGAGGIFITWISLRLLARRRKRPQEANTDWPHWSARRNHHPRAGA